MRHAGPDALEQLEGLRDRLRKLDGMIEKRPGAFYRRSRSVLHFHEDPSGLYADVRTGADFERVRVTTEVEQARLVRRIRSWTG